MHARKSGVPSRLGHPKHLGLPKKLLKKAGNGEGVLHRKALLGRPDDVPAGRWPEWDHGVRFQDVHFEIKSGNRGVKNMDEKVANSEGGFLYIFGGNRSRSRIPGE